MLLVTIIVDGINTVNWAEANAHWHMHDTSVYCDELKFENKG